MRCRRLLLLAGAVYLAACADNPAGPSDDTSPPITPTPRQDAAVAALGTVTRRSGSGLVLTQQGFELDATAEARARLARYEPSIGRVGDDLVVIVDAATQTYVNGQRVSSLADVPLGARLVVAGTPQGGGIKAMIIGDLASVRSSATAAAMVSSARHPQLAPSSTEVPIEHAAAASLCIGQDMDYNNPRIHEFHGCWFGPSASNRFEVPNISIGCGILGCWVVDEISYTAALAGWVFDWPFYFAATSPGLTYHIPSPLTLSVQAYPASGTAFTFAGGLGLDLGLHVSLCNPFGCFDAGTFHFNTLTTAHQTTGAGPLRFGEELQIGEVSCPSIGIIPGDLPIDPVSIGICEDLTLQGAPFETTVHALGARGRLSTGALFSFQGSDQSLTLVPDSTFVAVTYRAFSWVPPMSVGIYFAIDVVGGINLWKSPTIPIGTQTYTPITTPYPNSDAMTLATNRDNFDEFLYQPTIDTVAVFKVAPAPTTLTIISSPVLEQGTPMRASLTESYDGSPIAGAQIRFTATSTSGTVLVAFDATDGSGIAETILPNGEHDVVVEFAGSEVYLPSSATQHVFVYLPTTFVIWGGNPGGVALGGRYQFWGAQWHRQVTDGDFTANASFKGYAHTVIGDSWIAGGGNSTRPPEELGELIGVLVSTSITKEGDEIRGNVAGRVVLRVENLESYRPNPGHSGFGIMRVEVPTSPSQAIQARSAL